MTDQDQSNIQQFPLCRHRQLQSVSAPQDPSAIPLMQLVRHSQDFNMAALGRPTEGNSFPACVQSSQRFARRQKLVDIIDEALDLIGEDVDTPISSLPPSQ